VTDLIFEQQRQQALTVACPYCRAAPGRRCANPRTGHVLQHLPAHLARLQVGPETKEANRG
jgi:hypothetical protein